MVVPTTVLQWKDLAAKYCQVYPVLQVAEILSIIWNESTGNPNAVNPNDPSWGLMQVTMPIARAFGVTNQLDLLDPDTNVKCGAGFLAEIKTKWQSKFPQTWVIAYNEGEGNLLKGRPDTNYLTAFLSHMQDLEQALK
jgi:soluble lytic murein transglycosylase-like protein